ncbi:ferritin-like domain-containing protein [Pedobacter sp. ASV28]|uniref:ferritin-like domain-containing protein n=1 Tax=Pedobacter sp. ASV28 TaxID=2795123 RepID=UPI0018ED4C1B|nr:ferritin-like domain-containing protein [Pedobacter sp. ASV28]
MHNSKYWVNYFSLNLKQKRINWEIKPELNPTERKSILRSLQAWQLGETSEGSNLIKAATKFSKKLHDEHYVEAIKLFIKEEQKHGNNLGNYLDLIGEERIKKNWGDSLFRKFRGLYTDMEFWTIAVITVESAAQIFYQCLKDATNCKLLKQICTDILIDEAPHISFQIERLHTIFNQKNKLMKYLTYKYYHAFYFATALVVWQAHQKLFKAGGVNFQKYWKKMSLKFEKTIEKLKDPSVSGTASKLCQS